MILEHVVRDPETVMLHAPQDSDQLRLHASQCCGRCRAFEVLSDCGCRCNSYYSSMSTACQCVSLSTGIFFTSKAIRNEALRLFWSVNAFMAHGTLGMSAPNRWPIAELDQRKTSILRQIESIPTRALPLVRRLILDTDCPV